MAEASTREVNAGNQRTILIVEDDEVLRMVLRIEFEKSGFKVREADNGKAGLASYAEMHPDIIVTDIEMPVMDGFTFIRAVRKADGKTGIPIIAISAMKNDGITEKAVAAGANQFCQKPFPLNSLVAAIKGHLPPIIPLSN